MKLGYAYAAILIALEHFSPTFRVYVFEEGVALKNFVSLNVDVCD